MTDLLPLTLLFLFGAFAVLSALFKSRAYRGRVAAPLGITLALMEGLSGLTVMLIALSGPGSLEMASRAAIVTVALLVVSSTVHVMKVRQFSRAREASEGKRLYVAVNYPVGDGPNVTEAGPAGLDSSIDLGDGSDGPEGTRT